MTNYICISFCVCITLFMGYTPQKLDHTMSLCHSDGYYHIVLHGTVIVHIPLASHEGCPSGRQFASDARRFGTCTS